MALQPNQRAAMRGKMSTAKRTQPAMVNRTNKTVLPELLAMHQKAGPRFGHWHTYRMHSECWDWEELARQQGKQPNK